MIIITIILLYVQSFDEQLVKPSPIDSGYAGYLTGSHDPTSHHVSVDTKQLEFDNEHYENKVSSISVDSTAVTVTVLLG